VIIRDSERVEALLSLGDVEVPVSFKYLIQSIGSEAPYPGMKSIPSKQVVTKDDKSPGASCLQTRPEIWLITSKRRSTQKGKNTRQMVERQRCF
jgi:hypothetical protein